MKTSGKHALHSAFIHFLQKIVFLSVIALSVLACSSSRSVVGIPANETFVLGELENRNFRVELKNLSDKVIQVKAINTETKEQTQGFGLEPKGEVVVNISKSEAVHLVNTSASEVRVKVLLNKSVEGMRYQPISGIE